MENVDINVVAQQVQVRQPWIWQLSRDFEVKLVLKRAQVDLDSGRYLINLEGSVEELQRATAWLMSTGMHVEAQKRKMGV